VGIIHYHFITILFQFISLTKLCLLQIVIQTIVSICTIVCSLARYVGRDAWVVTIEGNTDILRGPAGLVAVQVELKE